MLLGLCDAAREPEEAFHFQTLSLRELTLILAREALYLICNSGMRSLAHQICAFRDFLCGQILSRAATPPRAFSPCYLDRSFRPP